MTIWTPQSLDPALPKYQAIAAVIAESIRSGLLEPGDRLPTHRDLADMLNVNVSTVTRAYKEAMHLGLVSGTVGRGTFIAADSGTDPSLAPPLLSPAGSEVIEMGLVTPLYSLDPDLGQAMKQMAEKQDLRSFLEYTSPEGFRRHRQAGAVWAERYGYIAAPDNIMIFSGAQHALTCCCLALFRPGMRIAVDNLTYPGIKQLAAMTGLELVPVDLDDRGMVPEALDAACRRLDIHGLYLIPGVQNPTTAIMPAARRDTIADLVERHGLILLEDDAYALTREDLPAPLATRVPERSIFLAGVSKIFWAGLRVCFAVVPGSFRPRLSQAIQNVTWMTPPVNVALVSDWILNGRADVTASEKRNEAARRHALAEAHLRGFNFSGHRSGYFLWLRLPEPWTGIRFEHHALKAGVRVFGAEKFVAGGRPPEPGIRISLTGPPTLHELSRGLSRLKQLLSDPFPAPEGIL